MMVSTSRNDDRSWTQSLLFVRNQLLLVPEAGLLVLLLALHIMSGSPPVTALLGLLLIGWFGTRSTLISLARRALDKANYPRATRLIRAARWLYPFSADVLSVQGTLALARGRVQEAEQKLRQAISLYRGSATLQAALSGTLLEAGHPQEARREAIGALAIDAACASAYLHLAHAEEQLEATPAVVEARLREGLRQHPTPADEAALRTSLALLLLSQSRLAEAQLALAGIETLLDACPTPQRAAVYYCLGELRRATGDVETARGHFHTSETLDPHGRCAADAWRAARL